MSYVDLFFAAVTIAETCIDWWPIWPTAALVAIARRQHRRSA